VRIVASYHDLENIRHYTPARYEYWHEIFIRRQGEGRRETCSILPSELSGYSSVIIGGAYGKIRTAGDRMSPAETAEVLAFMESGGTLAVTLPSYMRGLRDALGEISDRIRVIDHGTRRGFTIEKPDHPLVRREEAPGKAEPSVEDALEDILEADEAEEESVLGEGGPTTPDPSRMISARFSVLKVEGAESLAADGENSCYMIVPVGKGRLVLMPEDVLPELREFP
jgi:hypothetical protein